MTDKQLTEIIEAAVKRGIELFTSLHSENISLEVFEIGMDANIAARVQAIKAHTDERVLNELQQVKSCETYARQDVYINDRIASIQATLTNKEEQA